MNTTIRLYGGMILGVYLFVLLLSYEKRELESSLPNRTSNTSVVRRGWLPSPDPCYSPEDNVWRGPTKGQAVFTISSDYPTIPPPAYTAANYPWLQYNPTDNGQWRNYMWSVLKYAYKENVEIDWRMEKSKGGWYHALWMHRKWKKQSTGYGGREWVHGLTKERTGRLSEIDTSLKNDTTKTQVWAVSLYNEPGGYTLGKVWRNLCNGELDEEVLFPLGTVAVKLLFTTASPTRVKYLAGGARWEANISETDPNTVETLHLLQVDIAVRDDRANGATGWVFGTFVTCGDLAPDSSWGDIANLPDEQLRWYRVRPLGLTWGNDTEAANLNKSAIKERFIDSTVQKRIREKLGWMGRLNGPADSDNSSCIGCHSLAQRHSDPTQPIPMASGLFMRNPDSGKLKALFTRNLLSHQTFDSGMVSLDYSLQLQTGIDNYWGYLRDMLK